jgi:RNA polymerase sigma factor (sigma-70 family)
VKPLMAAAAVEAPDEQLVAAARDGSDAAFEALFRRYRDRITAYVRGIVADHGRAEDIVQDVFISAHRNLLASDREIAFKPWVYEVAKNACIDQIRRAKRSNEVSIDSDDFSAREEGRLSAGAASTDATVRRRQELDSLKMAFNELPEQQHEVLVMRELEGLSYDKISRRMGLSRSAVESMLFRARRRLKDEFDDIETGERCLRVQGAMAKMSNGGVGMREERRLFGHLHDCATCRREAVAMGLDALAVRGATGRARSALSRAASFLPLPAFLRRRWGQSMHLFQGGSPAAEQGASLAAKAVAVVATVALVGGGAGVAHKAGVHTPLGGSDGSRAAQEGSQGTAPAAGSGGGMVAAPSARSGRSDAAGPGTGIAPRDPAPGKGSAQPSAGRPGLGDAAGPLGKSLQGPGDAAQGTVGKGGSVVNGLAPGVQPLTDGAGQSIGRVGSGAGDTAKSVGNGAADAVKKVGGSVGSLPATTVPDVQPTLKQVVPPALPQGLPQALPQAPAVPGVNLPSTPQLGL